MSIKSLPSMEYSFNVDLEGSDTKQRWSGNFVYKRPNLRVKSQISRMTARLNEDLANLDEDTVFLHRVLAALRHNLIESPQWWKDNDYGFELYDLNIILEIYRVTQKFENDYFEKVWGNQEEKKDEPV